MFLLSLFIYHENKKIKAYTIFLASLIITLFVIILDFVFIKNHPNIFDMPPKESDENENENENEDVLIDVMINENEMVNEEEIISKKEKKLKRKVVNNPYKINNNSNYDYEQNNIESIDNNNFINNNQINQQNFNQNNEMNNFEQTDPFDNVVPFNS